MPDEPIQAGEDEEAFLARRAQEERAKMEETACMVRSVHDEMAELYEERLDEAAGRTAALAEILDRIDRD